MWASSFSLPLLLPTHPILKLATGRGKVESIEQTPYAGWLPGIGLGKDGGGGRGQREAHTYILTFSFLDGLVPPHQKTWASGCHSPTR